MQKVRIEIVSIDRLLMNAMGRDLLESLRTKTPKPKDRSQSLEDEAKPKFYRDEDGSFGIPTENLLACLAEAGRSVQLDGKTKVSTATSTKLYGFMSIEETFLKFDEHDLAEEPDLRRGRNPNGGEAVALVRPMFRSWKLTCTIEIDEQEINPARVRELFRKAGRYIGLGDFRPSCKGPFGRFKVAVWEVLETYDADDGMIVIEPEAEETAAGNGKGDAKASEAAVAATA